ncbi:hypothetical protein CRUP_021722 [Coryphaenoides rupestris]|nr:hypothetical protein CRUP_021722 [Coryphaenoides rupestris]
MSLSTKAEAHNKSLPRLLHLVRVVNQVLVSVPGGGVLKALATVFTRVHHVLLVAVGLVLGRRSLGGGASGHHGRLALRQVALPQQAVGGVTAPGSPRRPGGTPRVRRVPVLGAGRRPPGRLVGAKGVLASQVREVSSQRGSVGVRVAQLGAGKAGGEGTVVVVEVVAVGVTMSLRGARVRAILLPEQLRAGLEPANMGKCGKEPASPLEEEQSVPRSLSSLLDVRGFRSDVVVVLLGSDVLSSGKQRLRFMAGVLVVALATHVLSACAWEYRGLWVFSVSYDGGDVEKGQLEQVFTSSGQTPGDME